MRGDELTMTVRGGAAAQRSLSRLHTWLLISMLAQPAGGYGAIQPRSRHGNAEGSGDLLRRYEKFHSIGMHPVELHRLGRVSTLQGFSECFETRNIFDD